MYAYEVFLATTTYITTRDGRRVTHNARGGHLTGHRGTTYEVQRGRQQDNYPSIHPLHDNQSIKLLATDNYIY
jgi:hypothetical protein